MRTQAPEPAGGGSHPAFSCAATPAGRRGLPVPQVPRAGVRPGAGFSLVEALVGLALLGLVLTASLAVTYRLPRDLERLAARREANRAAESALETVRAGAVPLAPGRQEWPPAVPAAPDRRLRVWVEVIATDTPSLYHVAVEARYRVLGEDRSAIVETLAWRP